MVVDQISGALGGDNVTFNAKDAPGAPTKAHGGVDADRIALARLLDAKSVNEVVKWMDSLLGRTEERSSSFSGDQETRRQVAAKLKRLATLKRAMEQLEADLRRQRDGLALQLKPGLSDQYVGGQHCGERERRSFPLSFAQQQMLALQQMHPDSSTYNVARAVRVTAALSLDVGALRAAVFALLAKHETLRTLFALNPLSGEPQQIVLPIPVCSVGIGSDINVADPLVNSVVRVRDWVGPVVEYDDDQAMGSFITAQATSTPFDLARELPVRVVAIRAPLLSSHAEARTCAEEGGSRWALVAVLHHIVTDGTSSAMFWRDLFESYASFLSRDRRDETAMTKSLVTQVGVVQYRDYAVWQRKRVQSGALDASIAYWVRQLAGGESDDNEGIQNSGPAPILELPFDKKPTHTGETSQEAPTKGDIVKFRSSDAAFARMVTLCQSQGCSLFMGLLAVFYVLLSRLSGGAMDVTIGTPVSARDREELQQVMGYFVNTLPLRIRSGSSSRRGVTGPATTASSDEGTFAELLQSVRDVVLGAFAHMEVPFHEILERVRASGRRRRQMQRRSNDISCSTEHDEGDMDESRVHSLYQVMFALEQHGVRDSDESDGHNFGRELLLPHATAKFDLMLTMRVLNYGRNGEASSKLEGEMEFPLDRFTRESVERFARYYCELLEQVTQYPDASLRRVSMLPKDEQKMIVNKWGAPPSPAHASTISSDRHIGAFASPFIDECLREQVRLTPANWALHFDNGASWSYATLWRESGRVLSALSGISTLRDTGAIESDGEGGSQLRVGLFLARGLANAAAIVGAMRARAVFVPLDVSFPRERLRYMIRDAALHAIVIQRSHATKLSELLTDEVNDAGCAHVRVLTWEDLALAADGDAELMGMQQQQQNKPPSLEEDVAAYILYTSGSTGAPKGVVVSHGNLLTTLRWTIRAYDVSSDDVFLQSTSATLDGSLTQLLSPLLAGGAAVITRDGGLHDLEYMRSLLSAQHPRAVTYCVFVPSYLSTLLDYHHRSDNTGAFCFPPTLKHVVVVGEAFPMELARKFYRLLLSRGRRGQVDTPSTMCLVNEYGPTEAAVTSTSFCLPLSSVLSSDEDESTSQAADTDTVPIGVPIDGRRAVVLDPRGHLVPPNVCGELFLGGAGVSLDGYWRRPELTETAFHYPKLSDMLRALSDDSEARWYRTGDVVKWLPDGNLVFVGRVDAQVKLRGQRVELNEVRNVLLRHESVVDAEVRVVTPGTMDRSKRRQGSGPRLVAFVIQTSHSSARYGRRHVGGSDGDELVAFLRERLPLHMVPQEIRAVARWPRTPNGKLDVRALLSDASLSADEYASSMSSAGSTSSSSTASPRTSTDRELDSPDNDLTGNSLAQRVTRNLLVQIWRQVLDLDDDSIKDGATTSSWHLQSFFSLGGDSLAAIRAISLARARGIALTLDAFFTCSNVVEMAARASAMTRMASLTSQPLVPLNVASSRHPPANDAPLALFLIHCADGTVWKLLELASLLPFRVVGIQATGTHAADTVETLAERYWAEIQSMQPRGPYALGGFSFGCRVAHEVARIASHASHRLCPLTLLDGVPFYEEDNHGQDVDVEAYITETFGGRRPHGDESVFFDQLAGQFRAHCAMEDAYRPLRSCADGDSSSSVTTSTRTELSAVVYKTDKWDVDAAAVRAGGVDVHTVAFPGSTHLSLLRRPHVVQVAQEIRKRLDSTFLYTNS